MGLTAVIAVACGAATHSTEDTNGGRNSSTGGSQLSDSGGASATGGFSSSGGANSGTGGANGSGDSGGESVTAGSSSSNDTGGTSATTGGAGGTGGSVASGGSDAATGGSNPAVTTGGTSEVSTGGSGAAAGNSASSGAGGSGGVAPPYAPRTGSFKMLAYSVTRTYRHASIAAGQKMLQEIGKEQGFEVTVADNMPNDPYAKPNQDITPAGLAQYEIVFFMNSSGDVFNDTEQAALEDWLTTKNGAFAGVHAATDTESGWSFYKEMTGQASDQHDVCCPEGSIQWQSDALDFVAVKGLPNPWVRSDEWLQFSKYKEWSSKAGFKILSTVTTQAQGTRPVSYVREWGNFRSFYTSLGHDAATFQDVNVKKHIAAGIMWAVRREALLDTN